MLQIDDRGVVRWLTIDRPERLNAIPPDGWSRMEQAFEEFSASDQRVLVVRGAGENFCAGADLSQDASVDSGAGPSVLDRFAGMGAVGRSALALHRIPKPTIAAVDGVAVGAGLNLALLCDLVVVTDRARLAEIFVRRGLTLDYGGSWILPRLVGAQRAKELALTGRMVGATEAVELGMALEVVAPTTLESRVGELAEQLAAQSPLGQMFAKQNLNAAFGRSLSESLSLEAQAQTVCLSSNDASEGVAAFRERREPVFGGR
jgi:2-(1,2-epoxy-1,2-dihydrophenyl)acetyl-CoA isomerase